MFAGTRNGRVQGQKVDLLADLLNHSEEDEEQFTRGPFFLGFVDFIGANPGNMSASDSIVPLCGLTGNE
jgi:hypothetical protein